MLRGEVEALRVPTSPLDVLAQQVVACVAVDRLVGPRALRPGPRGLSVSRPVRLGLRERAEADLRAVPDRLPARPPPPGELGPGPQPAPRAAGDRPARGDRRGDDPRDRPVSGLSRRRRARGSASWTRSSCSSAGSARRSCWGRRRGGSRRSSRTACSWHAPRGGRRTCPSGAARARRGPPSWARPSACSAASSPAKLDDPGVLDWLRVRMPARPRGGASAARLTSPARSRVAGAVPDDRTVVVEAFLDPAGEIGLAVLTPFGGKLHHALKLALQARLRRAAGDHGLVPARRRRGPDPAPAGRRAPAGRLRGALGREGRGLDPRRAGRQRPVRPPVPPERGEGPADAPPRPRQEVSALAATAPRQGLAPGRAPGAGLPDPGRDLPRVPRTTTSTSPGCGPSWTRSPRGRSAWSAVAARPPRRSRRT